MVRRVSGQTIGQYFNEKIAEPLNLDFWIGLPDEQFDKVTDIQPSIFPLWTRMISPFFKMIPKSKAEADEIQKIIKAFKTNMLPTMLDGSVRRQIVPSLFEIEYMYMGEHNKNLHKISKCVLESMNVTYGGDRYRTYEEGVPVETSISLSFKEMDLITAKEAADGF